MILAGVVLAAVLGGLVLAPFAGPVWVTAAESDGAVEHGRVGRNLDDGTEGTALAGFGRGA